MPKNLTPIILIFSFIIMLVSCGGGYTPPTPGDTPTPTPSVTPTPQPTTTPETFIGDARLCSPGDTARVSLSDNDVARFTLNDDTCETAKDNRKEEYTMIFYNTSGSPVSFRISSPEDVDPFLTGKITDLDSLDKTKEISTPLVNQVSQQAWEIHQSIFDENNPEIPLNDGIKDTPVLASSIGDSREYKIRTNYDDASIWDSRQAKFIAEGTNIELWVDHDIITSPIHWSDTPDALRLDPGNLQGIVDVYESNILPLETALLGSNCSAFPGRPCPISDIDNNGKVTVIITPVLNWISGTSGDPDHACSPAAYVDTRNLEPQTTGNPMSNEEEVIFIYAPDTYALFYHRNPVDLDSWLRKGVYAWLTVALEKLISYNFHVKLHESSPESDWIDFGLGGVLADLAGFNIWVHDVWAWWLDSPAYNTIIQSSEFNCSDNMGPPYLFMSYMLQSQVDAVAENTIDDGTGSGLIDADLGFLSNFMSPLSGTSNLENAIEVDYDSSIESEFDALFKNWTVSLVTSGTGRTDLQIVGSDVFKYYYVRSSDAAMSIPDSRLYGPGIASWDGTEVVSTRYGADGNPPDVDVGNPVGIDLNGYNYHSDYSDPDNVDLYENPHEFTYTPGNKFWGYADPLTANFVRLGGLLDETTDLVVESNSPNLQMFIVRRSDITYPRIYSESIFGSLNQIPEDLDLPPAYDYWSGAQDRKLDYPSSIPDENEVGDVLTVVGRIDPADLSYVWNNECEDFEGQVPDFDKYQITIPDNGWGGEEGQVAIWIDRQADAFGGQSTLKPMLAVVSWDDIPYPSGRYDYTDPNPDTLINQLPFNQRANYRYLTTRTADTASITVEDTGNYGPYPNAGLGECNGGLSDSGDGTPNESPASFPDGVNVLGTCWPDWITFGNFFGWTSAGIDQVLFNREILKTTPNDPTVSDDPDVSPHFDPRSINGKTLDCEGAQDPLETTDPDDFLSASELKQPSLFQEQILIEMSRNSSENDSAEIGTGDMLVMDFDSRDKDDEFFGTEYDSGNNVGGRSVTNAENAMLEACTNIWCSWINEHIWRQLNASDVCFDEINCTPGEEDQLIYDPAHSSTPYLILDPGSTYVIIVGGKGGTVGNYELKMRKILPSKQYYGQIEVF